MKNFFYQVDDENRKLKYLFIKYEVESDGSGEFMIRTRDLISLFRELETLHKREKNYNNLVSPKDAHLDSHRINLG